MNQPKYEIRPVYKDTWFQRPLAKRVNLFTWRTVEDFKHYIDGKEFDLLNSTVRQAQLPA